MLFSKNNARKMFDFQKNGKKLFSNVLDAVSKYAPIAATISTAGGQPELTAAILGASKFAPEIKKLL